MKVKRRPHPETIPGARYYTKGTERLRTSVPIHAHRKQPRAYTAVERETLSRRDPNNHGRTLPRNPPSE